MIEGHSPRQKSASVWKMDNLPASRLAGGTLALHATGDQDGMENILTCCPVDEGV